MTVAKNHVAKVNDGRVLDSETAVYVGKSPYAEASRMSITIDRTWLWLRFDKPLTKTHAKQILAEGGQYSSKKRLGYWFAPFDNDTLTFIRRTLGIAVEMPKEDAQVSLVNEVQQVQQATQQVQQQVVPLANELRQVQHATAPVQHDGTTFNSLTHPVTGKVYSKVHRNKGGKWCDADGKLVPAVIIPEWYKDETAPVQATVSPATPVQATATVTPATTGIDKLALLKQALEQNQAIIDAIRSIA